jgi:threonylcarbamoyladenosine tRNA methylthiotransferase MtaB
MAFSSPRAIPTAPRSGGVRAPAPKQPENCGLRGEESDPVPGGGEREANPVCVVTMGCRLNAYESQVMRAHAEAAGMADAVIVNTCAVTAEAVRQASQAIRRLHRENPHARIIVTGCAAQTEPGRFAGMPEVDAVIGNAEKMRAETFAALSIADSPRVIVDDIMSVRETASAMIDGFGSRARAYMQVQNGCDHRCTFCIIPFGRGPSRSVPAGEVVAQAHRLVEAGHPEIVLTGVDLTAYGLDLPGSLRLGGLVRHILRNVPGLRRLRLSSIDQVEADRDLIAAIAEEPRLMPHLHLSLQSGDDMILKRMKRRHDRADAVRFCAELRRLRPDVVFGADLIAGFPTETGEMFINSLRLGPHLPAHLPLFAAGRHPGRPHASGGRPRHQGARSQAAREGARDARRVPRHAHRPRGGTVDGTTGPGPHTRVRRGGDQRGRGGAGRACARPRHWVRRLALAR